jgi:hypothetical protein
VSPSTSSGLTLSSAKFGGCRPSAGIAPALLRFATDLAPEIRSGLIDQQVNAVPIDGFLRGEKILECPMYEVDPAEHWLPDHTTTLNQVVEQSC